MEADFSGWATKAGLKCTDGRTIMPDAFKHQDKMTVPLVWQHGHSSTDNILGHAILENRGSDGVYCYGFFNNTKQGVNAKTLVQHEDIKALSIYANQLIEKNAQVLHGSIKEVSLVLSGANPGAFIDYVRVAHADGEIETLEDEAIIYTGLPLEHESTDTTVQDVYDSMTAEQKEVVHFMIGAALESASASHSDEDGSASNSDEGGSESQSETNEESVQDLSHNETEGNDNMSRNVFEQTGENEETQSHVLSHSDVKEIVAAAIKGGSLKAAVEEYALAHGITNIDLLFPDAKSVTDRPEFDKRRTEWVAGVINGTRHTPFSRIKSLSADLTFDEARAKGYVKGNLKKEEFFGVQKRVTTPTTVYKKQKLDRDDIIDITDFDVVAWLKAEMRLMLEEELARAVLIGDGRDVADADKIKDPTGTVTEGAGIRSILNDHELYAASVFVNVDDASSSMVEVADAIIQSHQFYKGTGTPVFYTTLPLLTKMLLSRDTLGRRLWKSKDELASELMVADIVTVEVMESVTDLVGILVNLQDYSLGADKGGEVSMFDDFDIDYNQYKYLMETRVSGALTKIRSAVLIKKTAGTNVLVDPVTAPTFVVATGVVTIPTQTGVVYKNFDTNATLTAGAQTALAAGDSLHVIAVPATGYYFSSNQQDEWTFTRPLA